MISNWKQQATENMAEAFASKSARSRTDEEARIKELHARQLTVERVFGQSLRSPSQARRKSLAEPDHPRLSIATVVDPPLLPPYDYQPTGESALIWS